eukprot:jgi/Mesvir1/27013/Mv20720-RA.1
MMADKASKSFRTLRDMVPNDYISLDDMTFVRHLGEGAFASVEEYKHNTSGQLMAVKKLRPEVLSSQADMQDFANEAALMRKLKHPHICAYLGVGDYVDAATGQSLQFICQELLSTGTINSLIQKKKVALADAFVIGRDIAKGLEYLHGVSPTVIHRDMKPDNVLLDATGTAKITDFGMGKLASKAKEKAVYKMTGETGSYRYMAPEVYKHENYDEKVDIFSWSIIFYEMLTNETVYSRDFISPEDVAAGHALKGIRPRLPKQWPEDLKQLLASAWAQDPKERPSCAEIVKRLNKMIEDGIPGQMAAKPAATCCIIS